MRISLAAAAFGVCAASAAGPAWSEPVTAVEPLTLLENGQIAGCGVTSATDAVIGEVIAFRQGDQTAFSIRARPKPGKPAVTTLRFATASHQSSSLFPPPAAMVDGIMETRTVLEGFTGSSFAQELMVMGGRFEIDTTDGRTITYDLPRPMPHRVRQAYLNCAGDLFRPEHE